MTVGSEWDSTKKNNLKKHGIAFREARSVFLNDEALLIADPDYSLDKERFILIGLGQ